VNSILLPQCRIKLVSWERNNEASDSR
jgi:hypothetical protein